ncbi:MAG: LuxR C-terminal-related transcriptional regulator [Ktedonobacterales bacterium]
MRVFVVAQYPTIRAGLASLVQSQPDWKVVGEVGPAALLAETRDSTPTNSQLSAGNSSEGVDVVLADLDGIVEPEIIGRWLGLLAPSGGLVVISLTEPEGRRSQAREAPPHATLLLSAVVRATQEYGLAFGALPRDASREEIVAAITAVGNGLVVLDRRLAGEMLSTHEQRAIATPLRLPGDVVPTDALTARELEVLQLLAQGLPNKLIASRLHITEHTAKFHVSSIMLKLGAASRTEAVTLAARRGLLLL